MSATRTKGQQGIKRVDGSGDCWFVEGDAEHDEWEVGRQGRIVGALNDVFRFPAPEVLGSGALLREWVLDVRIGIAQVGFADVESGVRLNAVSAPAASSFARE